MNTKRFTSFIALAILLVTTTAASANTGQSKQALLKRSAIAGKTHMSHVQTYGKAVKGLHQAMLAAKTQGTGPMKKALTAVDSARKAAFESYASLRSALERYAKRLNADQSAGKLTTQDRQQVDKLAKVLAELQSDYFKVTKADMALLQHSFGRVCTSDSTSTGCRAYSRTLTGLQMLAKKLSV